MRMSTVTVPALPPYLEDFPDLMSPLLTLHVEGTETFDAWSVAEVAASFESEHLGESGGVHTFVVGSRYFARSC